jgi:DNA-directed RNA polymerase specialized sigma24 family protein
MATMPAGMISRWGECLRDGDAEAAAVPWDAYGTRLVDLARGVLRDGPLREDAEDAAVSGFHAFCHGMTGGRFREYRDRDAYWALLATLVRRKARGYVRRLASRRHGAGMIRLGRQPDAMASSAWDPARIASGSDAARALMAALPDPTLRRVAALRAEGHTDAAIAERLGCSQVTIERKVRLIRHYWAKLLR